MQANIVGKSPTAQELSSRLNAMIPSVDEKYAALQTEIEELRETIAEQNAELREVSELRIAAQERDLAVAAAQQLQAENGQLQIRLGLATQELDSRRKFEDWLWQIAAIPSTVIEGNDKWALVLGRQVAGMRKRRPDGTTSMNYELDCDRIGVHARTLGRSFLRLEETGFAVRKENHKEDDVKDHISIALTDEALTNPASLVKQAPKSNRGGKRVKVTCPSCGSDNLWQKRRKYCGNCKHDISEVTEPVVEYTEQQAEPAKPSTNTTHGLVPQGTNPEPTTEEVPVGQPVPMLRRPLECRCSVRFRWVEVNGSSHCTHCEPQYRRYA